MKRQRIREIRTLIVRLGLVVIIAIVGYLCYKYFFKTESKEEIILDETPLKVEQIRAILELNTLKFQDETVVDSLESYQSEDELWSGTFDKLFDPDQFKNGLKPNMIKRRLVLIVRGELLYGVDLKRKDFQFIPKGDTLEILIPQPELLSISLNPKGTEVYLENGKWKDYERIHLQRKAREKMIASGNRLKLPERAKAPLEKAIRALVRTDKIVVVRFSEL